MGLATKTEFAAICNVAKSRVSHWIKDGLIYGPALVGFGRNQKVDVAVAQSQLATRRNPEQALGNGAKTRVGKGRPPAEDEDQDSLPDYHKERARLVKAQADAQEIKNATLRGELIPAQDAERRWTGEIMDIRARTLAGLGTIPQRLPHLTKFDLGEIDRVIRDAMTGAARG